MMNKERINELAEQAEILFYKGRIPETGYEYEGAEVTKEELQKFAELIVRECINRMGEEIVYNDSYKERNKAISDMMEIVKQHFGV
jgi:hypothetical protein